MEKKRVNTPKSKMSLSNMNQMSKLQPQARDLEEAVLGALMLEKYAPEKVASYLKKDAFYVESHQMIYEAILQLFMAGNPVDILTVTEQLRKNANLEAAGGAFYITSLTNRVSSAANIEYHAHIVIQKSIQRQLISVAGVIGEKAFEETSDAFELLDESEKKLFEIKNDSMTKNYDTVSDLIAKAIKDIEESKSDKDGLSGIATGFTELDRMTSGWQNSDLIILAARPGMGKTAFVLSMAKNSAVQFGQGVAVFSLEMSSVQLTKRLMAMETGISSEKLRKGFKDQSDWDQLHSRVNALAEAPIFIDDTPALSIFELRAKCRRLKMQHDIKLVIIDYLQLMTAGTKGGNREQEISTISRSIKEIAKEINVPIIALSQLSRSVETRGGDKRPMLSDLRESGAIEQDADMVVFIYRPEYYGLVEDENGMPTDGIGEIIVAKHRNGSLDTVRLRFIKQLTKFDNLDAFDEMDYGSGFAPNKSFEAGSSDTITVASKMNDDDEDFLSNTSEEVPF